MKLLLSLALVLSFAACSIGGFLPPVTGDTDKGDNEPAAQSSDDVGEGDQGGDDAARAPIIVN